MSLTLTDMFCGAGGSSSGALRVEGVQLALALNHWRRAIETHQLNFDAASHDCCDVSATDPRRYPRTDILWASPECTNHSLAKGVSRKSTDPSLFESDKECEDRWSAQRSRATMFDVVRFAERHRYEAVIVENVVDARRWSLWPAWWQAMELLGYVGQCVYVNSGHLPGVPQSRDRMYVVWWRKGARKPDLELRPSAWCGKCGCTVEAAQSFRNSDRKWGRYRQQYDYRCPACWEIVEPPMDAAATAIDWRDLGERIGERAKPLADKTLARIEAGLRRYGFIPAVVQVAGNTYERKGSTCRYRPMTRELPTVHGTSGTASLIPHAFIAELRGGSSDARHVVDPLATVCASGSHHMLVNPPRALIMRNNGSAKSDPAWTVTPATEELRTLTTAGHQSLLVPMDRMRDPEGKRTRLASEPLATQTARQDTGLASELSEAINECRYRMLQPHEIQRGMAMHEHPHGGPYRITGSKREQVAQLGNAVTPPAARFLVGRVVEALAG